MDTPEVLVKIKVSNMDILEKRFHTCEEAWQWFYDTKRYHKNRRSIKDKKSIDWAFYCGCTCRGNVYGGYLIGSESYYGSESLMMSMESEKYIASKRSNWTSPGIPYANLP